MYAPQMHFNKRTISFIRYSSRAFVLLFIFAPSIVESFAPLRIRQSNANDASSKRDRRRVGNHRHGVGSAFDVNCQGTSGFVLFNSNDDGDKNDEAAPPSSRSSKNDAKNDDGQEVGQKVGFGILSVFGYTIQLASWLISAGLVLNILGYGYQFDREAQYGVKIDTLKNIRQENQMRNEFARLGKQRGASPDPLRSLQRQQQEEDEKEQALDQGRVD